MSNIQIANPAWDKLSVHTPDTYETLIYRLKKRADHLRAALESHSEMVKELHNIENILACSRDTER